MSNDLATQLPLAGFRMVELADIWAGPYCGTLLGDLGAEVIKIESIQRISRGTGGLPIHGAPDFPDGVPGDRPWNRVANFNVLNRNKLGITLDLTNPKGVDAFKELASISDAIISNYSYGVMDKFGLGYDSLRQIKPDLVVLFMPGFGNTGPHKRYRSMGMTIDALTGHTALRGYPDLNLSQVQIVHHPDAVGGVTAAFAICTALNYRARNGKGQFLDMSQAEAFMPHLGEIFLEYSMTGHVREQRGNRNPAMAPCGCYPCSGDDQWVTIAVRDEREWLAFCRVAELADLIRDKRFSTLEARIENQDELDALIAEWTSARSKYDVTTMLQDQGIPAGPVLDCCGDTYDDPHLQQRGYFQEVTHPEAGTYPLSGPIWKLSGDDEVVQHPAPCLGEHNPYVLRELLGLSDTTVRGLEDDEVIGTAPLEGADMGGVRRFRSGT